METVLVPINVYSRFRPLNRLNFCRENVHWLLVIIRNLNRGSGTAVIEVADSLYNPKCRSSKPTIELDKLQR